jgi:tRNA pseudouridine38-40 synthase
MYNYKLILAYDGSRYLGWQKQVGKEDKTIQGKLELVLSKLFDEPIELIASGRTDAGVHAKAQVANFQSEKSFDTEEIEAYCLKYLPLDISLVKVSIASSRFHSRYNAIAKTYCYTLDLGKSPSPFTAKYAYHIKGPLDIPKMQEAAKALIGTHDFASFTSLKSKKKSTIRHIHSIDFKQEGTYLKCYFKGNGFLQHMVRILMGTLLEIGMGEKKPEDVPHLLAAKQRSLTGFMAPSHGLMLEVVDYD